ncbi:hypothetical protein [Candidatus Paracaedibacter symbiosus]|uniref:hypothetical protein n=1 Tax=Candidatus Paracaedibacter symbiosus TaxID=244582 RepID=UPI000509EF2F|nr:hypothetical protein [Candidatus Paracaedibacter symbiosus]
MQPWTGIISKNLSESTHENAKKIAQLTARLEAELCDSFSDGPDLEKQINSPEPQVYITEDYENDEEEDRYEQEIEETLKKLAEMRKKRQGKLTEGLENFMNTKYKSQYEAICLSSWDKFEWLTNSIKSNLDTIHLNIKHINTDFSKLSIEDMLNATEQSSRYLEISEEINRQCSDINDFRLIVYNYYVKELAKTLLKLCDFNYEADTLETWQTKTTIVMVNLYEFFKTQKHEEIPEERQLTIEETFMMVFPALEEPLLDFYKKCTGFLVYRYTHERNFVSQGLNLLGAKSSETKRLFEWLKEQFPLRFPSIDQKSKLYKEIEEMNATCKLKFDEQDQKLSNQVSNLPGATVTIATSFVSAGYKKLSSWF